MLDLLAVAGAASAIGGAIGAVGTVYLGRRKQKHSEDQDWFKAVQDVQTKFDEFKEKHLTDAVAAATEKEHLRSQAELMQANHERCEEKHNALQKNFEEMSETCKELQERIGTIEKTSQERSNASTLPSHPN